MARFRLGVIVDSFRLPLREGLKRAASIGAEGVQMFAVHGDQAPEGLDAAARRDLAAFVADQGLVFSALCGDMWLPGFTNEELNPERIQRSKLIVDLAKDLGAPVVTTHIGIVPSDPSHPVYDTLRRACKALGDYGNEQGIHFAIETGPEPATVLRDFLKAVDSPGIGVNLDPANLAMVIRDDPVAAVKTLAPYIVHTHAKDGINIRPGDPHEVYGNYPGEDPAARGDGKFFREVPLGEGDVKWPAYLDALTEVGYKGFLTVEREAGDDPARDIGAALEFLRPYAQA